VAGFLSGIGAPDCSSAQAATSTATSNKGIRFVIAKIPLQGTQAAHYASLQTHGDTLRCVGLVYAVGAI